MLFRSHGVVGPADNPHPLINVGSVLGADDPLSATRFVTAKELLGDAPPATAATDAAIATAAAIAAVANRFLAGMFSFLLVAVHCPTPWSLRVPPGIGASAK